MKKAFVNTLVIGMALVFAGVGTVGAQPAQARNDSRNPNIRHDRGFGSVLVRGSNRHVSHPHRPYVYLPYRSPYRPGYFARSYYPVGYWPYYGNYWNYGYYGYGFPGVGVGYTVYSDAASPGYALGGAVLGGVLGGIIGNNSGGRNTWAGAAIGSTIGLLAGNAADNAAVRRQRAERDAAQIAANNAEISRNTRVAQPETPAPPNPRRVETSSPATPMSQANALFGRQ